MKTTASPHLLIVTASLLAAIAFAAEGYATSPDDTTAKTNAASQPAATKEPLPAEIASKPAPASTSANAIAANSKTASSSSTTTAPEGTEVSLPPIVVESPAPVLSTDAVLTHKGAGAAARERQFGGDVDRALNSRTLPLVGKTPEERALAKEQEEKRLAQITETKAAAEAIATTQPKQAGELKQDAYDMTLRPNSFNEDLPPSVRRDAP